MAAEHSQALTFSSCSVLMLAQLEQAAAFTISTCALQSMSTRSARLVQSDIASMCEMQRIIQIALEVPATSWQKHCRKVMTIIWHMLRVRKEEVLKDMSLLTAAKYFKYILPLGNERAPERLGKHYLQIFVNLLRSSGPEHNSTMVLEAVDTMMPCLGSYDVGGNSSENIPTWVNYVRKIIMENTDTGSSAPPCPAAPATLLACAHALFSAPL
jgi:hypothetical protein